MARLILVRHGQTRSNVQGVLDTDAPGPGLTELGRAQAAALVEVLAGERIDRIVASPLQRTVETATPLARERGLPLRTDPGLREILAGDLETNTDRDSHLAYLRTIIGWAEGDVGARIPGDPESGTAFFDRYDRAVEDAVVGADTVVCVSHGAAIRTWAASRAVNLDGGYGGEHGLPNTGVVILERHGSGPWAADVWLEQRIPSPDGDPIGAPIP